MTVHAANIETQNKSAVTLLHSLSALVEAADLSLFDVEVLYPKFL